MFASCVKFTRRFLVWRVHILQLVRMILSPRAQKDAAVTAKDLAQAESEKKMFTLKESDMNLSNQVESLLRKNRHLAKQMSEMEQAYEKQHGELVKAEASRDGVESQLQDAKRQREYVIIPQPTTVCKIITRLKPQEGPEKIV